MLPSVTDRELLDAGADCGHDSGEIASLARGKRRRNRLSSAPERIAVALSMPAALDLDDDLAAAAVGIGTSAM